MIREPTATLSPPRLRGWAGAGTRLTVQRGRIRFYAFAALLFAALIVWALWPQTRTGDAPSITALAQHAGAASADSLSARVIPDEDLPPQGTRSLFDHLLAQNDGLPYPFEKLIDLIQELDPQARRPDTLLIPLGRSLLKAQADFAHPRALVAADFQAPNTRAAWGLAPRGQLFLGFVENAHEIEVISYNEAAGRFEFQLVQNYCDGCVPRIVYAPRAVCSACHQGGAPIFPVRPWNETNAQPEIAQNIAQARGTSAAYLSAPIANPLAAPERFDELTDVGNFFPVAQRAWLDGCGGVLSANTARDAAARPGTDDRAGGSDEARGRATDGRHAGEQGALCRRQMLKVALRYLWNPGDFDARSAEATALRNLQKISWPARGIAVPQSDLPNRDPLAERRGLRGFIRGLFAPKSAAAAGAKTNADLAAFDQLPKLPALLDPLTHRTPKRVLSADGLDGAFGLAQFFTEDDVRQLEALAQYAWPRLDAAVDAVNPALLGPQPFARIRLLNALRAEFGQAPLGYCCLDTSELSPPLAAGAPPLELSSDSPLQPFKSYCFACHRGNPSQRLDFMAGATESDVQQHIQGKSEIRDALDWSRYRGTDRESKLMPPADSRQRRDLEQALAQDPALLENMRKQVPSLFDF